MGEGAFRVGFVPGVVPDTFARRWRERERRELELVRVEEDVARDGLVSGALHMALVRLPVDDDGLHLIRLYDELPVAVMAVDHVLTLLDDVDEDDLADEVRNPGPAEEAIATAAAGTGVALVPMSVARLHHRKDVTHRVRRDAAPTTVGLAWLRELDDPGAETFVGVVRGRRPGSTRDDQERRRRDDAPDGQRVGPVERAAARKKAAQKAGRSGSTPRSTSPRRPARRPGRRR